MNGSEIRYLKVDKLADLTGENCLSLRTFLSLQDPYARLYYCTTTLVHLNEVTYAAADVIYCKYSSVRVLPVRVDFDRCEWDQTVPRVY